MKKYFLIAVALLIMSAGVAKAQVTIGSTDNPHSFSILELVGGGTRGLRLPQMTTAERDAMVVKPEFQAEKNGKAKGLQIFNTDTKCVEIWNGSKWIESCAPPDEEILFTIETYDGTYIIPTSGYVGETYSHTYDWNISVDDVVVMTNKTGTGSSNGPGIALSGLTGKTEYQIRITPNGTPTPGWGNAFGYARFGDANNQTNKNKLISIDAPLTTMAFAPKISENPTGTNASYMFYNIFYYCTNLTTGAKIVDTYKLPETVTDLSYFLYSTHCNNTNLTSPIDLSGLKGWLDGNTTITNLREFLCITHDSNTNLEDPIDLTPLSGWFKNNTTITNLRGFLYGTHYNNTNLEDPIDLTPLSGWFKNNTTITNLLNFLYGTHYSNTALNLTGQKIFPNWIKTLRGGTGPSTTINDIKNVPAALYQMFFCDSPKGGDTGEPEFEDDTDPITGLIVKLSDLGNPSNTKYTYQGRTGITSLPIGDNWK
ncbi:MAG: hypothetical protein LBS54_01650 [Dysgonamonadaceae bacterium]|jgi:hypothetical protein|nr:hypothetical protein [Dysgonamonadaceae bacterium]